MAAAIALGTYLEEGPRRKKIRTEALGVFLDNNKDQSFLLIGISEAYRRQTKALFVRNKELCDEIRRLERSIEDEKEEEERHRADYYEYLDSLEGDDPLHRPRCRECGEPRGLDWEAHKAAKAAESECAGMELPESIRKLLQIMQNRDR